MFNKQPALPLALLLAALLGSCAAPAPITVATISPSPSATASPSPSPLPSLTPIPQPGETAPTFFLSLAEGGYQRLFAYAPGRLPLTRLSAGQWNDASPALSPDASTLLFASDRNNYWDIYLLNLDTAQVSRLTDTPEYNGSPAWSPDGQWVIYESLQDPGQLEIVIQSTINPAQSIQLTQHPAQDQQPAWSPQGRQIAFVSDRAGNEDIWVADLDKPEESRFVNLTKTSQSAETQPVWSPDGTKLAWASRPPGQSPSVYVWDTAQPQNPPRRIAPGDSPRWNPAGDQIASRLPEANQDYLLVTSLTGETILPPQPMGVLRGMDWGTKRPSGLPIVFYSQTNLSPTPVWEAQFQLITDIPNQRSGVVKLQDVQAPHPYLQDAVDEAFSALRQRAIQETGWDVLANLESAYTPLTASLDPGKTEDWLSTGRAFSINPLTAKVGWLQTQREEVNGQTYWRLYVRVLAQDGSQGEPLRTRPWDMNARYSLNTQAYEEGGALSQNIPTGYWLDFTALAQSYGWQRPPALHNWRTYYQGARFNQFILTGGLDWRSAMLQLYPPDVFVTPTIVIPPSRTPTITPTGYRYKSPTPTETSTATMQPTYTPAP